MAELFDILNKKLLFSKKDLKKSLSNEAVVSGQRHSACSAQWVQSPGLPQHNPPHTKKMEEEKKAVTLTKFPNRFSKYRQYSHLKKCKHDWG